MNPLPVVTAAVVVVAVVTLAVLAVAGIGRAVDTEYRCRDAASVVSGQCEPRP